LDRGEGPRTEPSGQRYTALQNTHTHTSFFTTMNTQNYNPFKAVAVELVSPQAQEFYATQTLRALTFALIAVTETVRLGYLFGDWVREQEYKARKEQAQQLLGGFEPYALLASGDEPKEQTSTISADLVNRMISVVDEVEASKPRPRNRRVGHTTTNIAFGIDGKTVKELRVLAKEQGYRNTSKLTKRELLGLMA
jgi:hypothetical protein